jgi:hypothetical protein
LVALYFSVEENTSVDGEFFALRAIAKGSVSVQNSSPFSITKPVKFYPNVVTPRIRAKGALFVIFSDIATPLDQGLRRDWIINKIIIPSQKKESPRYDLFRVGIHASLLFPDIDGFAARLRRQHTLFPQTQV